MSLQFEQFKSLHYAENLFVLPNAWNAKSAVLLEQQGFPAIATSSAAVAESLGYGDGEQMSFEEYFAVIKHIISVIRVPLTVDIETGYANADNEIYSNIEKLIDLGVAGINPHCS
jgi:2-methylisocitrate lyase-like PEP mutase family enzyme